MILILTDIITPLLMLSTHFSYDVTNLEGGKRQHSLCERFEVLPDEMKQIVVDTTCDQYLASIEEPSFSYQGYAEDSDTKKKFVHKR